MLKYEFLEKVNVHHPHPTKRAFLWTISVQVDKELILVNKAKKWKMCRLLELKILFT